MTCLLGLAAASSHRPNYKKVPLSSKEEEICYKMVYYTLPIRLIVKNRVENQNILT